jgi:dTDP-4-dehydrorhamnose 3,5-epimerase-like enzyme
MNQPRDAVGTVYKYYDKVYVVLGTYVYRNTSMTLVIWDDGELHWYVTSVIGSEKDRKL